MAPYGRLRRQRVWLLGTLATLPQPGGGPECGSDSQVLTSCRGSHERQVTFQRERGCDCDTELTSSLRTDSGVYGEWYVLVTVGKPGPNSAGYTELWPKPVLSGNWWS